MRYVFWNSWKSLLELNPLIQNIAQQDYLPELFVPPVSSLLSKIYPSFILALLPLPGEDCAAPSTKPLRETLRMGR